MSTDGFVGEIKKMTESESLHPNVDLTLGYLFWSILNSNIKNISLYMTIALY